MRKTVVINVVGLSRSVVNKYTPFLSKYIESGTSAVIKPAFPAVTCTAQSNYLTGKSPSDHGIVANGWYYKDDCEIKFWKQSNKLVQADKIWDQAKKMDSDFTVANMFWWFNMYSSADISVTPRPQYPADGRKIPDIYTQPAGLRDKLQKALGTFPLFDFWGPKTSVKSSRWIADSSIYVDRLYDPTLTFIYLPHLDYCLQKHGENSPETYKDLIEIDNVVRDLVNHYEERNARVIILSEYGISPVNKSVSLNRELRKAGFLAIREENGLELLDAGASKAFAVADHQVAHIYVNDPTVADQVKSLLQTVSGVEEVLDKEGKVKFKIDHIRAGDFVAIAEEDAWFDYYYWLEEQKAPDFARTVDIHRKPGYDPVEMFVNPKIKFPLLYIGSRLIKKKLGFRTLLDVIPLDPGLVKGSHGRIPDNKNYWPLFISKEKMSLNSEEVDSTDIYSLIMQHLQ
ncbi:MAG: alkaline phosphatase family protein [Cytophagaceae bacterium]